MSLHTGNGPQGCQSSSTSRTTCSRELEKVPEKVDSGTKHKDFLESEGCFANTTSSDHRVSPSYSAVIGGNVSKPPASCRVPALLDPAADLDLKSSSSHSDHCSETSLPAVQKDKYLEEFSMLKLQTEDGQRPEWTFYPRFSNSVRTYHVGKQCFFKGAFLGNKRSLAERTVDKCLGRKKYDIDRRNGIPKLTPGDNLYMYPEQSKDFHKVGSTLPPVNFSIVPYEKKFDTFIPLEPLPQIPNLPFWVKEKANMLKNEIREVEELDNWQPAIPFMHNLFSTDELLENAWLLPATVRSRSSATYCSGGTKERDLMANSKEALAEKEHKLEEHKRKLARVSLVRKELRPWIQSLPDLLRLPNVTGSHMHLPFAEDVNSED